MIIRNQQRLIDQDTQEDIISYEKSEKRLIVCGLGLAGLCSLSSLICIISVFQAFEVKSQNVFTTVPIVESVGHFPIPHAAFMNAIEDGYMLVFKQTDTLHFDYAWKFKVPDQGGINYMCLELQFSRPRWRWVSAATIASDRYV